MTQNKICRWSSLLFFLYKTVLSGTVSALMLLISHQKSQHSAFTSPSGQEIEVHLIKKVETVHFSKNTWRSGLVWIQFWFRSVSVLWTQTVHHLVHFTFTVFTYVITQNHEVLRVQSQTLVHCPPTPIRPHSLHSCQFTHSHS